MMYHKRIDIIIMFTLYILSKNDKNAVTKYIKRKNINYEIVTHIDPYYSYCLITMIDGKIDLDMKNDTSGKYMLFICYDNLVTVAKFCTKNNLTVKFCDISRVVYYLLRDKIFEDLSYLYKHKFINDTTILELVESTCTELDAEDLEYLLDFKIDIDIFRNFFQSLFCRKDVDPQMAKILLNYCRKRMQSTTAFIPNLPLREQGKREQGKHNNHDNDKYTKELSLCAQIAIREGQYEIVEILMENGFDSSIDNKFVNRAFRQGQIDICDLLVSNGFPFEFDHSISGCIVNSQQMINEKIDFIYQYYIDINTIDPKLLQWIRKNFKDLNVDDDSLNKYGMSGEEFLTIIFTKLLIVATLKKSLYVVKAIIATEIDFSSTIKNLSHNRKIDENICLYFKSILKNKKR